MTSAETSHAPSRPAWTAWYLALVWLVLAAVPERASANGRPPGTATIHFRQDQETDIAVGLTFGLVYSHDGGKTWAWVCEDAIGYQGMYDPRYAYTTTGALFATTFDGLKVERDRCTFGALPSGKTFVSTNTLGPDRALYVAAAQAADPGNGIAADFAIYKSIDDGATFTRSMPPTTVSWWESIRVAPSNPMRVYLSGYRYVPGPGTDIVKQQLLFRSDDGARNWTPLPVTDFLTAPSSAIELIGITSDDPDHLYARVKLDDNMISDSIYRSFDRGATWQKIRSKPTSIGAFVVRARRNAQNNYDLILGTQALGAEISHDAGETWEPLVGAPHMNCLVENTARELWACTQNYGFTAVPTDDAGVMKTTDLVTWTKVLRYQDLSEVVACAAGTIQNDACAPQWCAVCQQLGCTPAASYGCPTSMEAPVVAPAGCCDTGSGSTGGLGLGVAVLGLVLRRRRRRRSSPAFNGRGIASRRAIAASVAAAAWHPGGTWPRSSARSIASPTAPSTCRS
jgi:uncharacterized protein (TIGR03382 family)